MMSLFPEPQQTRLSPRGQGESRAEWLRTSTRDVAVMQRSVLNAWFERFGERRGDLRERLVGDDHHVHTVNELLIGHLLSQSGSVVVPEEADGDPDWRVFDADGRLVAIVECLTLNEKQEWAGEQIAHGRVADELNKRVRLTRWFVDFEVERLARFSPVALARWVDTEIARLDLEYPADEGRPVVQREWSTRETRLLFEFVPCSPGGDPGRIVASGAAVGGLVDSGGRLGRSLRKKLRAPSTRSHEDVPLALAVILEDSFCDRGEVLNALYGPNQFSAVGLVGRPLTGFFGSQSRPRSQQVGCVFVVENWRLELPDEARLARYDHPSARARFPERLLRYAVRHGVVSGEDIAVRLDFLEQ